MGNKVQGQENENQQQNENNNVVINQEQISNQRLAYLNRIALEQQNQQKESETEKAKDKLLEKDININTNINSKSNVNVVLKDEIKEIVVLKNVHSVNKSNSVSSTPIKVEIKPQQPKKDIDLEHVTIEKMFKITLEKDKSDKMKFVESYLQTLIDCKKELKFRVNDLDNLIITLIEIEKKNIVGYLLTSFHRGYELIEVRFKDVLAGKFSDTNRLLISYFSMIITSPENFDIDLKYDEIENSISKYIEETKESNEDELLHFFTLCFQANEDNPETSLGVFNFIINIINRQNVKSYIEKKANVSIFEINSLISFFKQILLKKVQYY